MCSHDLLRYQCRPWILPLEDRNAWMSSGEMSEWAFRFPFLCLSMHCELKRSTVSRSAIEYRDARVSNAVSSAPNCRFGHSVSRMGSRCGSTWGIANSTTRRATLESHIERKNIAGVASETNEKRPPESDPADRGEWRAPRPRGRRC